MYNQEKIQKYKKMGFIGLFFLILLLGLGVGITIGSNQTASKYQQMKQPKVEKKTNLLSEGEVKKFLIAYYTKKDLGENKHRIEPFMTTNMFQAEQESEQQPVSLAYKGYVVDQVLTDATIYIDTTNMIAICEVNYKNTQRQKINNPEGELVNQPNTETIRLTYKKEGKAFLVNKIERVTLVLPTSTNRNSYVKAPEPTQKDKEEVENNG
ncbi:hypothetical protein SAMN02745116_00369 [Pilibacter termitis]|uniref:Uncharacterized protein n=1 Tax=Pilibacter termitis TaxID=263852 RepID=A0A1T4KT06_9ENTE|nr:hypothetical protein [Pilibacter termitis]SJZ45541.1 hypothetical protein SAMN02745116_00369 [Pilibacter termitis]